MKIYQKTLTEMKQLVQDYTAAAADATVAARVAEIIARVRKEGDAALKDYSKKFDGVELDDLRVAPEELDRAAANLPEKLQRAFAVAKENITSFHQLEVDRGFVDLKNPGIVRGQKITPLKRVGLYVPGGTAAYPSTIMMNAIPAKLAGVDEIVMVTPPQPGGIGQAVLAAAKLAGVSQVYQVGGAQAIAALAYGTESIPQVDKIVGPGNIYVATAKQQVLGKVAIDMVAGPSEIGIVASGPADPRELAADLLSQAEHDRRARAMLVTDSRKLAEAVSEEVDRQLATLPRKEIAEAAIRDRGFIAVMADFDEMFDLMNAIAPEHLELQVPDPMAALGRVQNAGSVFLGRYASEPLGDYLAGPNHVLPTGGTARYASPLGVYDFVKRTQFVQYDRAALQKRVEEIADFARAEGLEAHARAVEARFERGE